MRKRPVTIDDGLRVKQMGQPLKKFSAGQVSCALWENEAKVADRMVSMLKATVERRYRDSAGNWRSSQIGKEITPGKWVRRVKEWGSGADPPRQRS